MYARLRPLLFRLDPEEAHRLTLSLIGLAGGVLPARAVLGGTFDIVDPRLETEAFGIKFKNPVGLAAGYDKNGVAVRGLSTLGFGHIEVGTLTPKAQAGNPRPRVHRLPEAHGLINRLGFPNFGVDEFISTPARPLKPLLGQRLPCRVGINLGKGKDTPLERAAEDYVFLLRKIYDRADYVTINISSPNTPDLRKLQTRAFIESLLRTVTKARDQLKSTGAGTQESSGAERKGVPILVKIAPDLTEAEIDDVLEAIAASGVDGIIATNTTLSREGLPEYARPLQGGLSGQPLKARATEVIRLIAKQTGGRLPIIGVGGVASAADAAEKLDAGATLVQVYTGLVYKGPGLIRAINLGLANRR
jgi:dihydroorotate dehydrogenase